MPSASRMILAAWSGLSQLIACWRRLVMVRLTHACSRQWFFPGLSPNRWRTRDCISIMFDRGNSDMKTTVLAAALLALLTSPAAAAERGPDRVPQEFVGDWCVDQNAPKASIDDEWWTAHGRNELAMISTRGSDAAVAAPTPPRAAPAPARNRRRRAPDR